MKKSSNLIDFKVMSVKLMKRRFDHVTESLIDVDCPR